MQSVDRFAIVERLKHSIQLLACPAEIQLKMLPRFVCRADELALDFDLWKEIVLEKQWRVARKMGGHGRMDYIMNYRLMDCLKRGLRPDIDVYDAAAWSAPTPLSEASVAQNGAPQKFPDFTRDHWKTRSDAAGFAR